jgi:hypothetical protein
MGIEVQLRREHGEILAKVSDPLMTLARASTSGTLSGSRLLRYLVPWGDAIFNQTQAEDLAFDIRDVIALNAEAPLGKLLREVEPLVGRLSSETQLYLWFVGD